jgi:DNA replication protein DnaC
MARAIQGESNSLLLLGGPGSGKSAIIAHALNQLKCDYPDPGSFYTIRLDGQIQTDDKIALKEIARQLALEMNVEMEKVLCIFEMGVNKDVGRRHTDYAFVHVISPKRII